MKMTYYIGLDVHSQNTAIAYALGGSRDKAIYHGQCGGSVQNVERNLRKLAMKLGVAFKELKVCYEAGPTGFVLARRLLELGVECVVMAPAKTERKSNDRVKTDPLDARKIAKLFRNGDITTVRIPPVGDEAMRDLCRARTDAVDDLRRTKQRLSALLLRNQVRYRGKSNWTEAHMRYLRDLRLAHPIQKLALEEYIQAIDSGVARVERLEATMREVLGDWEWEPVVQALMAHKGFREVAAMTTISELGDLTRFKHPRQLMGFLGLVPSEHRSGTMRRQGAITKCGNSHARWMLIESAQSYRNPPKISAALSKRQEGQPRAVKELSWRAQHRLHRRYARLKARGKNENKALVAIARELCAFVWELHQIMRDQLPVHSQPETTS